MFKELLEQVDKADKEEKEKVDTRANFEPKIPRRVRRLVGVGRFRNAAQLLGSNGVHDINEVILKKLESKFPIGQTMKGNVEFQKSIDEVSSLALKVTDEEVLSALNSFPREMGAGKDGLKAQHLVDMLHGTAEQVRKVTLDSYTAYVNLLLSGQLHASSAPFVTSAPLIPLMKKDLGVRPIAIGEIWRRLVSKTALKSVTPKMIKHLAPFQMGVGISTGAEAILHSVERVLDDKGSDENTVMLKVDFTNAFPLVDRNVMFEEVKKSVRKFYLGWLTVIPLIHGCM